MLLRPVAVVLFCKAPQPGTVKTRLCPPLTPEQASHLAAAFIRDVGVRLSHACAARGAAAILAYAPATDAAVNALADLLPDGAFAPMAQVAGDLGVRMSACCEALFARGHAGVVIVGSDAPTLPLATLLAAIDAVTVPDAAVMTPVVDGGYVLIGMSRPAPHLFAEIAWSTASVAETTRRRAIEAGLALVETPVCRDIDGPDDLVWLAAALAKLPAGGPDDAPATRRAVSVIGF